MPTFDTPRPITATINLVMGDVRITASDRTDTVVEVRPATDSAKSIRAAEQTTVEYANGRLLVKTPKQLSTLLGRPGSIEVEIALPAGSSVECDTGMGDLRIEGRVGACRFHSGMGLARLGDTGPLRITTGAGEVSVVSVAGDAEITTGLGQLRIGRIDGTAVLKNSNGETRVGEVAKPARINSSNGEIIVDRALAGVVAKTAFGAIRVGEARRGEVVLETAFGELEVGIPAGTAAWLELRTGGSVRNTLDSASGPEETDERVQIRARTSWGDILIHRTPQGEHQ
jgi:DUF4097 and DUF4098 domain-containing protein YvlB